MKTISKFKYIFILIGLGMLIGALFSFLNTQEFLKTALTADGTVIELVRTRSRNSNSSKSANSNTYTYNPVVEFITPGGSTFEFTSTTGSNPPSYSKGDVVEILYEESSPERARINSFFPVWGVATILGFLGSVFFLVGFLILLVGKKESRKIEYLRKNGFPIKAKIQNVEINGSLKVNGKRPYKIVAQWINPTTSELHIFTSENIWFDPTDHINSDEVTVLIERDNPKKYYVDISFLPKVAS